MNDETDLTPPDRSPGDFAHLAASGVLSIIPGAAELFHWFVATPLEKRQEEWMNDVAEVLRILQQRQAGSVTELQSNEAFVSLVTHATLVALKNHHQTKRTALRNALLNAGTSPLPGEDIQLAFVRFVDELSPLAIVLLRLLIDRQNEVDKAKSYGDLFELLAPATGVELTQDMFRMLSSELQVRGLIRVSPDIGEFPGIYEASHLLLDERFTDKPFIRVSEIGQKFIEFIAADDQAAG